MPSQSKIQGAPIKRHLKQKRMGKQLNDAMQGKSPRRLGGVFNASPMDPSASQREPLGTFDPKRGTWTPKKNKKQGV